MSVLPSHHTPTHHRDERDFVRCCSMHTTLRSSSLRPPQSSCHALATPSGCGRVLAQCPYARHHADTPRAPRSASPAVHCCSLPSRISSFLFHLPPSPTRPCFVGLLASVASQVPRLRIHLPLPFPLLLPFLPLFFSDRAAGRGRQKIATQLLPSSSRLLLSHNLLRPLRRSPDSTRGAFFIVAGASRPRCLRRVWGRRCAHSSASAWPRPCAKPKYRAVFSADRAGPHPAALAAVVPVHRALRAGRRARPQKACVPTARAVPTSFRSQYTANFPPLPPVLSRPAL